MNLFDPDAAPSVDPVRVAVAELKALAGRYRQLAAESSYDRTITALSRAATMADERAEELEAGSQPHI